MGGLVNVPKWPGVKSLTTPKIRYGGLLSISVPLENQSRLSGCTSVDWMSLMPNSFFPDSVRYKP